ncbi:MAG: acyl carrier protein [Deltaproteobacteria bacterium]|nr:acyl carrier protein [Deltaproteobacteria bacterium]MBW1925757.1 acyl carrier protein [Deltaproteobacteria bacterium]MBW1946396.1 acyl carrier protein [Deltaproteobacteria bacterium]MBW1965817.1 acyl carrier protein [Deltaproteobacteria bacterium]MBW2097286.1 acyl carrier protein [Deltaproteobacteria bacterium]
MLQYEDILAQIYSVLQGIARDNREINETTDLVVDLGLDSMAVMELLAAIEDRFDISIPLNILPDVRTVKDLALQIQQLMVES